MPHNLFRVLVWVGLGVYVLSRLYFRMRRTIGLQQFRRKRLIFYIVFYVIATIGLAFLSGGRSKLMLGWIAGLVPGIVLGLWSLRLTRFEITDKGRCYTPSAHIGVALYLLFLGRLIYRVIAIYTNLSLRGQPPPAWGQSALTDFVFELLAGYYIAYSAGIVRRYGKRAEPAAPAA
jgi:hypothetical protein